MNQDQIQTLLDQLASYALDAVGALVILLVSVFRFHSETYTSTVLRNQV